MEKKIIINIGRQFGGGGLGVAYELGKKLGIPVYDKELIAKAARTAASAKESLRKATRRRDSSRYLPSSPADSAIQRTT